MTTNHADQQMKDFIAELPLMPEYGSNEWIYDEALDEATTAALEKLGQYGDRADCGGAWVVIENARSPFVRFLKSQEIGERHFQGGWKVSLCGGLTTQSRIVYEASCRAFVAVLKDHGIAAYVYSYAD
ncbi:hypothetical protein [Polycladidibacter hongkongensis]|uniref:hypothetical protein n=1 Tax=Polycladidibacter hongkongensis TaxID=1647556 RepID=UPI0008362AAC|nr:hypothetical protein [Pseudovibrio hongkongensis]